MAHSVRIRKASRKDFNFILHLSAETLSRELTAYEREHISQRRLVNVMGKNLRRLMGASGMVTLVAETDTGERAGFVMVGRSASVFTDQEQAFVYDIAVAPEFRRRGIGRVLMEQAEAHARDHGMAFITLMVDSHNEAARALYTKLGFQESKLLMRKLLAADPTAEQE